MATSRGLEKVSVVVTTRNNADTLSACLQSICDQRYANIELIVVDNNSTDVTKAIARSFTQKVFNKGPERSAQRNYAAQKATGKYLLIIDSDMELSLSVVSQCMQAVSPTSRAVIIPEESFGIGFWAQCKALERSFYNGVDWIEAPRFFDKEVFLQVGGYDEDIVGGEDWDLHSRLKLKTKVGRIGAMIRHDEGQLSIREIIRSRKYYAKGFSKYFKKPDKKSSNSNGASQVLSVYGLLLSKPKSLIRTPIIALGMFTMKTIEYGVLTFSVVKTKFNHETN